MTDPIALTTLQLARRIADAVIAVAAEPRREVNSEDPATQAVIDVLHGTDCWFCRFREQLEGTEPLERDDLQPDLF